MEPRRLRRVAVAAGAAVVAVGFASARAPAISARSAITAANVVSHATTQEHPLTTPGRKVIESITLPAGNWSIFGKASVIAGNAGDFFRCELVDVTHGTVLDRSTAFLYPMVNRDVITNVALFTATGGEKISQECGHDGIAGDAGSVDSGADVVAFSTPADRVRLATSGGPTDLSPGVSTGVVSLGLPAGSWVVVAKVTPVVSSAAAIQITCSDAAVAAGMQRELGTASAEHPVSTMFAVGGIRVKTKHTMHLDCVAPSAGASIDSDAVLWAWNATALKRVTSTSCPVEATAAVATDALLAVPTGQCTIGQGPDESPLADATLKAGTWVALGGVFDLDGEGGANIVRCEFFDAKRLAVLDQSNAYLTASTRFPITGLANVAVVTVQRSRAVDADCGGDGSLPSVVSGGASWAFVRP